MGNCSLKGIAGNISDPIRIMTDSGGTVEFQGPTQVSNVVNGYPGYGVFREGHLTSPLFHHEQLFSSQLYYLLPLEKEEEEEEAKKKETHVIQKPRNEEEMGKRKSNVVGGAAGMDRSSFSRVSSANKTDLEKISSTAVEVLPSLGNGVWRVKMVIDTKQLEEILREQVNVGELIEKMREIASSSSSSSNNNVTTTTTTPRRRSWRPSFSSVFKVSPADFKYLKSES